MPYLTIGDVALKLVAEKEIYWPKNVRSFPMDVKVDGADSEFRLTTGKGRDGEIRRYAHVRVDGKAMWCRLPDDLYLPPEGLVKKDVKPVKVEPAATTA